jgi:hypothetical protein
VTNAEQGAGLSLLWGPIGKILASLPQADVIADCGRLGADGPLYDLLAEATTVVLVTKVHVADVIRLRDRAAAFAAAAASRGRRGFGVGVVVVADHKKFRAALGEVQHVLGQANAPATVLGGIAHDVKGADLLAGEWGGNLDRTLLIKTAREVAQHLLVGLPPIANPAAAGSPIASQAAARPPAVNPPPVQAPAAPPPVPSFAAPPPATSAAAPPRAGFSRVLGTRSGRHQADPGEALSAPVADAPAGDPGQPWSTARHAQGAAGPATAQGASGPASTQGASGPASTQGASGPATAQEQASSTRPGGG